MLAASYSRWEAYSRRAGRQRILSFVFSSRRRSTVELPLCLSRCVVLFSTESRSSSVSSSARFLPYRCYAPASLAFCSFLSSLRRLSDSLPPLPSPPFLPLLIPLPVLHRRFTQSTTAALHTTLTSLRARHAATLATLHASLASCESRLAQSHQQKEQLRQALDETGSALVRETVGRRREVGARMRGVGREEGVVRKMREVVLKAEERRARRQGRRRQEEREEGEGEEGVNGHTADRERERDMEWEKELEEELRVVEEGVRGVLRMLDSDFDAASSSSPSPSSSPSRGVVNGNAKTKTTKAEGREERKTPGTEGRMVLLESAVEMLVAELEGEVARRVELERALAVRAGAVVRAGAGAGGGDAETREGGELDAEPMHVEPAAEREKERGAGTGAEPAVEDETTPVDDVPAQKSETTSMEPPPTHEKPDARPLTLAPLPTHETHPPSEMDLELHQPSPRLPPDGRLLEPDYLEPEAEGEEGDRDGEGEGEGEGEQRGEAGEGEEGGKDEAEREAALGGPREAAVALPSEAEGTHLEADAPTRDAITFASAAGEDVVAFPPRNGDAPVESTVNPLPPSAPPPAPAPAPTHPLLADLAAASKRYDALQRAFRDCHLALEALRAAPLSSAHAVPVSPHATAAPIAPSHPHAAALRGAVARLHDYTEDARVELEIRVADARVLARGWETLVGMPDAASSGGAGGHGAAGGGGGGAEEGALQQEVASFIRRDAQAQEAFRRKLEDVEHDIAVVKRALYAPPALDSIPLSISASVSPSASGSPTAEEREGGGGWAAWLGGSSAPRTPPPEAPTFGSVMTSPRLRHSASTARLGKQRERNPLEGLGLRVAMPAYVPPSPEGEGVVGAGAPRQRTISGVYMLGLGVGAGSPGRRPSGLGMPARVGAGKGAVRKGEEEADVE
ncbi:hypothetical protein FB451DRAFT_1486497 [Mycena latifolia]|nr:hypothetical protein FB451DRAFT_1486497 [Mycena latifolia]